MKDTQLTGLLIDLIFAGLLQCYYLDAIVECDTCGRTTKIGDDENPFMRKPNFPFLVILTDISPAGMNSAMSTITYSSESCEFEWNNLSPSTVGTIQSEALQLGGSYWYAIAFFGNATLLM
jgi:hypothetical protein